MAALLSQFNVGNYDEWKQMFDSDPVGRKDAAKGHRIYRSVSDPSDVFIRLEFDSADEATSFRERLLSSGVMDRVTVKNEPTVVEEADSATY
jgi:hypothetical protein